MKEEQVRATRDYIKSLESALRSSDWWSLLWMLLTWLFLILWTFQIP